jgi:hypothetical protein
MMPKHCERLNWNMVKWPLRLSQGKGGTEHIGSGDQFMPIVLPIVESASLPYCFHHPLKWLDVFPNIVEDNS